MDNSSLIQQIKQAGLSDEQAVKTLAIIAEYTKQKFPILEGNINAYLKQEFKKIDPDLISRVFNN